MSNFRSELRALINKTSQENGSSTPDFILADYLVACLDAFDVATLARAKWYGHPSLDEKINTGYPPVGDKNGKD